MRTQEEILKRFDEADDMFGTQQSDLVEYMTFENAKPHLKEEYVLEVESGAEKWEQRTDPKAEILDYLPFAYEKAEDERGLSAARSLLHFKSWIWLDDEEFYNKVLPIMDNYTNYGMPALNMISDHYGYVRN